ncbi:hypothetical protein ACHAXT_009754 [Thalassiosira profunda]
MRSIVRTCRAALAALLLLASPSAAKIASGKVHLSGVKTESTLVKFAVAAGGAAKVDLKLTSHGMYEDEKELRFRVYSDDEWPKARREPLCTDKVRFASFINENTRAIPIVMEYQATHKDKRKGKKKFEYVEMYEARIQTEVQNPPPTMRRGSKKKDRSRYFYFVVDDCSLEKQYHDGKIPDMVYTIDVQNGRPSKNGLVYGHLPSDEDGIGYLLVLTIIFSGGMAALLFYKLAGSFGGEVHVAILVVMAACLTNGLSALCEIVHLKAYDYNGYGNYSLDALSGHFEALSDSMVSLILLSIGGGWTLPADVVGGGLGKGDKGNKLMKGVRNPAGSLLDLVYCKGTSDKEGGVVALLIILVHAGLAQWGRTFDDDFDTYHALEHPPGRALMLLRFVLGLIFVSGVGMVRSGGRCPPSLMSFLTKFGLVGLSYFASLPGVAMFVGSVLPYYQRHQALHWGAGIVQACSLASLTWLFVGGADASAYHRLSRAVKHDGDMTESLAAGNSTSAPSGRPSMWRIGKTKIRLD